MTPDIEMHQYRNAVGLNWDVSLLNGLMLWRNVVHGEATRSKFETMGWQFQVAVPLGSNLEAHYNHHSIHTLDATQPTIQGGVKPERFPVKDSYGVRIIFDVK